MSFNLFSLLRQACILSAQAAKFNGGFPVKGHWIEELQCPKVVQIPDRLMDRQFFTEVGN